MNEMQKSQKPERMEKGWLNKERNMVNSRKENEKE